jgi:multidrug resistance efflux pump
MTITFERDDLATVREVKLPAMVVIQGKLYDVAGWSFEGFRIAAGGFTPGAEVGLVFILPFPGHDRRLPVRGRVAGVRGEHCRFQFLELPPAYRKMMRDYFECSLQANGYHDEPRVSYDLVPPVPPRQQARTDRKLLRRVVFYGFAALALAGIAAFVVREFRMVYSIHGTVTGSLVEYKSPDAGPLKAVHVREGDTVAPGQVLCELDDQYYARKLEQLRRVEQAAAAELAQADATLEEEEKRIELFIQAARYKEATARNDVALAEIQADLAQIERARAANLLRAQAVTDQEFQLRDKELRQARLVLEQNRQEFQFQRLATAEAERGRFYSGLDVKANVPALRENVAHKRTELEQVRAQVVDLENSVRKARVVARAPGRVHALNRLAGDYVTSGEYVVAVEDGEPSCVSARFTVDDAKYLHCGMAVKVIAHARDEILGGHIVAIGHAGLTATGVVAPDQETLDLAVPVKIRLDAAGPNLVVGEGVDVKIPRSWSLAAFFEKLF